MMNIISKNKHYIILLVFQFLITQAFSQFGGETCIQVGQEYSYSGAFPRDNYELVSMGYSIIEGSGRITYDDQNGNCRVIWTSTTGKLGWGITCYRLTGWDEYGVPNYVVTDQFNYELSVSALSTQILGNTIYSYVPSYYSDQVPSPIGGDLATDLPCTGGVSYQWYKSTSETGPFEPIANSYYYYLSFQSPLPTTTYFKRKVTLWNGVESYSNVVKLFINPGTSVPPPVPSDNECVTNLGEEVIYDIGTVTGGDTYDVTWTITSGKGDITLNDAQTVAKVRWSELPAVLTVHVNIYQYYDGEYGPEIRWVGDYGNTWNVKAANVGLENVIQSASGKTSYNLNETPASLIETISTAGQNTCSPIKYQWLSSTSPLGPFISMDGATAAQLNFSEPLQQTTYYKRGLVADNGIMAFSNVIKLELVSVNWENLNYIREHTVLVPGVTDWKAVDQLPVGQKLQTTTYLDGIGRPIEKVKRETVTPGSGTQWGDAVQVYEYDPYGRQTKAYLPYTTLAESGKFKSDPITNQGQYYTTNYNESNAFNTLAYDNSPLNKVINTKSPGGSWANSLGNSSAYELNDAADNIQIFNIGYATGDIPVHAGAYADNTLFKTIKTDENNKRVIEYTNTGGQLICKKVQLDDNPSASYGGWICTYFIYDDFGKLRFTCQPEAVKWLDANGWDFNAPGASQMIDGLCFRYEYDERGRQILKKAPGAKELYMVYDKRDRLVFTQDGNQRVSSTGEWMVNFYDELDRVTLTGLYKTTKVVNDLQAVANNSINYSPPTVSTPNIPANFLEVSSRDPQISQYKAGIMVTLLPGFESALNDPFSVEIDPQMIVYTTTGGILVSQPVPSDDVNDPSKFTALKYNYYDNYTYAGVKSFDNNYNNSQAYPSGVLVEPVSKTDRTTGMITGTKVRVLETNTLLLSTFYYDEKGRSSQTLAENIKAGTDITTAQYHFSDRLMSSETRHSASPTAYSNFSVLTKYVYDQIFRVVSIQKKYGTNGFKTVVSYDYDDMGRIKTKHLDPGYTGSGKSEMESLTYSYNIHGQITGINKDYALKTPGVYNKWGNFFGLFLGFDKQEGVFNNARLDDLITGTLWTTQGDDAQRKYDYTYDNAGRLTKADFKEFTPANGGTAAGWSNAKMDFSVSGLNGKIEYDLNSNLLYMIQKGVVPGNQTPVTIDDLRYSYATLSNKLTKVKDESTLVSMSVNGKFGDFTDGSNGDNDDYKYDDNGNLVKDLNKDVKDLPGTADGIKYNYLDKPEEIRIAGKGTIKLVYDALGNKLQKIYTQDGSSTGTVTSYINGFVYRGDDLQYIDFEEGRIRVMQKVTPDPNNPFDFLNLDGNMDLPGSKRGAYDFFIRDYLGNVRMILTEETHTGENTCTMEANRAANEETVFGQVDANGNPTANNEVRARFAVAQIPGQASGNGWQDGAIGNYVSRIGNLAGSKIGPNALLKVMAGDQVLASSKYYYQNSVVNNSGGTSFVSDLLVSLAQVISGSPITSNVAKTAASNITSQLGTSAPFGSIADPDASNATGDNPKAYLGVLYFDERFNFVGEGSITKRVTQPGNGATDLNTGITKAPKNGYALVYVCNESDEMVYFDNLQVTHNRGRIIEEDHYYAYGLKIAGISSRKLADASEGDMDNKYLYNSKELIDEADLDWYDYGFRNYDAQIGRFPQLDPLTFEYPFYTPYQYAGCEPISNVDVDGLEPAGAATAAAKTGEDFLHNTLTTVVVSYRPPSWFMSAVRGVTRAASRSLAFVVGVANGWSSDNLGGWGAGDPERFGNAAGAARAGQKVGHMLTFLTSSLEMAGGLILNIGGGVLDAGGITAPVGVGAHIAGTAAIGHGLVAWRTASRALASSNEETGSTSSDDNPSSKPSKSVEERTIGESKWSSKEVEKASKALDEGKTDITVSNSAQAEELFLKKYASKGYKNTTDMKPREVKADEWRLNNSKNSTYHWDDADHNHPLPHLQIHTEDGTIIRISYLK